jgi:hypoxanthine phosphoribosyltransferase
LPENRGAGTEDEHSKALREAIRSPTTDPGSQLGPIDPSVVFITTTDVTRSVAERLAGCLSSDSGIGAHTLSLQRAREFQRSFAPTLEGCVAAVVVIPREGDENTSTETDTSEYGGVGHGLTHAWGYCAGKLGEERVLVLRPAVSGRALEVPAHARPTELPPYPDPETADFEPWVQTACAELRDEIDGLRRMSWASFIDAIKQLHHRVCREGPRFTPHAVIGVNAGGTIVAGIFHYLFERAVPVVTVSPKYQPDQAREQTVHSLRKKVEQRDGPTRILVVDTSVQSGKSLRMVQELLEAEFDRSSLDARYAVLLDLRQPDQSGGSVNPPLAYAGSAWFERFPYITR